MTGAVDITYLFQLFTHSYSQDANIRKQAEQALEQMNGQSGFISSLLSMISGNQGSHGESEAVRQAAGIYFKNRVVRSWSVASAEDKAYVKNNIISTMMSEKSQSIISQIETALVYIVREDFPEHWPELLNAVFASLASGDPKAIKAGITVSLILSHWRILDEKPERDTMINHLFTALLPIANELIKNDDEEAYLMTKTILKAYKKSMQYQMPACLQDAASLGGWCTLFVQVLMLDPSKGKEKPETSHFWKMKKWAFHCINHMFSRYGSPERSKFMSGSYKNFSAFFMEHIFEKMYSCYLQMAQTHAQTRNKQQSAAIYLTPRMRQLIFEFLSTCVETKLCWAVMKQSISFIVTELIFPELCHNDEDEELWQCDAYEYIHKKFDPFDSYGSSESAATSLLVDLARERKKASLGFILEFVNHILSEYDGVADNLARRKDGALCILGAISETLMHKKSPVAGAVPNVLATYVFPDFGSKFAFLRSRACWIVESFSDDQVNNLFPDQVIVSVTQSILVCLRDAELPVRIRAASALAKLLSGKIKSDVIIEAMRPGIADTMQVLLQLTNEGDMECSASAMHMLVEHFADDLSPYAEQLTQQLVQSYERLVEEANLKNADEQYDALEENGEKVFAAIGILRTLTTLILATKTSAEILSKLEIQLIPLFSYSLEHNLTDVYEELFELMETVTYSQRSISNQMWQLFPLIFRNCCAPVSDSTSPPALDYLSDMMPTLDNYISFGHETLANNPQWLEMFGQLIHQVMTSDVLDQSDYVNACKLMESLMMSFHDKQSIDQCIPIFLELVMAKASSPDLNRTCTVHLIEVVLGALYYKQELALTWLQAKGLVAGFFEKWFQHESQMSRVHDKKLSAVVLMNLLKTPPGSLPAELQSAYPKFMSQLAIIVAGLPKAEEEKKKLEEELECSDDEDDDDEDDEADYEDLSDLEDEPHEPVNNNGQGEDDDNYDDFEDDDDDDEDDDDDALWMEEETDEIFLETPLDPLNMYAMFLDLVQQMPQKNPSIYQLMSQAFSVDPAAKASLDKTIALSQQKVLSNNNNGNLAAKAS